LNGEGIDQMEPGKDDRGGYRNESQTSQKKEEKKNPPLSSLLIG
jgi:hypothetical protein